MFAKREPYKGFSFFARNATSFMKGVIDMIEFVKFLRDVFAVILALFGTFWFGMVFGSKVIDKAVDSVYKEERPRKVSYVSYSEARRK